MTSSLVGSEMCIRDSFFELLGHFRMEPMHVAEFFLEESTLAAQSTDLPHGVDVPPTKKVKSE
eukprot:8707781-Prorocentrum_lima.AAC.1